MGKLSILGAQRVKALTEILNEKEQAELREIDVPSYEDIVKKVDQEFGILQQKERLQELVKEANQLGRDIKQITGTDFSVYTREYSNYSSNGYSERIDELKKELIVKEQQKVKDKYKTKRQMLWLCETLEEAKEIVGI